MTPNQIAALTDSEIECCPKCRIRFNDYFIYAGYRYCYPCFDSNDVFILFEKKYFRDGSPRIYHPNVSGSYIQRAYKQ